MNDVREAMTALKQVRESIPLSIRELAKEANVAHVTIIRLEKEGRIKKPQAATIRAIVKALNKHLDKKITAKDIQF